MALMHDSISDSEICKKATQLVVRREGGDCLGCDRAPYLAEVGRCCIHGFVPPTWNDLLNSSPFSE